MLHRAAPAAAWSDAEIWAQGLNALLACLENFRYAANLIARLVADLLVAHALGGKRTFYENNFALMMRYATAFGIELFNLDFIDRSNLLISSAHKSTMLKKAPRTEP